MARIMVVDDEPAFLEMLNELLTDEGYTVITHATGDTAYATIRKQQPDLVILDMRMEHPEGGWMILDRMRLEAETMHIPVVICTGDSRLLQAHTEHLIEEGACILQKPFAVDELLAVLADALNPAIAACGSGGVKQV